MALAEVSELKTPVKSWVPSKKQLLIGGKWVDAKNGKILIKNGDALNTKPVRFEKEHILGTIRHGPTRTTHRGPAPTARDRQLRG